ncbi:STAS domain-containing protein [Treponema zioleckii]|uniref:STAS domain-containing protein n=1 Tax=Treponema zioleckii TaxID=331680 RepID=UPI00168B3795|nr:STAS domain-containing protein [Treponema zioleckii]
MDENLVEIPDFNKHWDKDLKITLFKDSERDDVLHVHLTGRIDTYNSDFFLGKLNKIFEFGITKLVFRCSSLEYVSSAGLGAFVTAYQRFEKHDGVFVFTELRPKVLEIFNLLGFNKLFFITNEVTEISYFLRAGDKAKKVVFPFSFFCPICEKKLLATKSGNFRCKNCKSIISISDKGEIKF